MNSVVDQPGSGFPTHRVPELRAVADVGVLGAALPEAVLGAAVSGVAAFTVKVDRARAEQAVVELLAAFGRDRRDEHLAETPRRVVDALAERLTPVAFRPTTFPNEEGYHDLVLVRDIPFVSLCEHHLLPFHGVAHVGYLPADRLIGLSKLARFVDSVARDLQVQERMTVQIAERLDQHLHPRGIGVVLAAEHTCMTRRGALAAGSCTITSRFTGSLAHDERSQSRFFGDPRGVQLSGAV